MILRESILENLIPNNLIDIFYQRIKNLLDTHKDKNHPFIKKELERIKDLNGKIPEKIKDLLKESQNFERGQDPMAAMGVGVRQVILKCQQLFNRNQEESGEIEIQNITCNRWAIEIHTNQDPEHMVGTYLIATFKELGMDQYLDLSQDFRTVSGNFDTAFSYKFKKPYRGLFDERGQSIYITN